MAQCSFFAAEAPRRLSVRLLLAGVIASAGCYVGDRTPEGVEGSDAGETGSMMNGEDEIPAPSTRLYRLTHEQWENVVQDLFFLSETTGLSAAFRSDAREGGYMFDNNGPGLEVDQALWTNYRGAAIELGRRAVEDDAVRAAIVPTEADERTSADRFVREFGLRVFRRPLTADEEALYRSLFDQGASLYPNEAAFDAGVRLTVEAMLQSPYFIYRVEESDAIADGVIELSEFEVAAKLSLALWNSMPDQVLFEAAQAATLRANLATHAERMLEDVRAKRVVESFHKAVFSASRFENLERSSEVFPAAPEDLGALAFEEFRRFVGDIVFEGGGGLRELLSSNESYVNDDLARIYGIAIDVEEGFQLTTLPEGQRRGILTQIGFLAANATSVNPDPIHRGKFVLERITCTAVPLPPDVLPPLPIVEGKTNRQAIEELTEVPGSTCAGCHSTFINPYGFPFETYDAIGAFRLEDNGLPVDPSSTIILDGEQRPISNPFDLVDALTSSPAVHRCYAKHWVEYMNGRNAVPDDDSQIDRLADASLTGELSVRELLLDLVTSPAFVRRSPEELSP